jgi:hypothetical protein
LYCQLADYVIPHHNKAPFIAKLQQVDWQSDDQVNHLLLYAQCRANEDKSVLPGANLINYQVFCTQLAACIGVEEVQQRILSLDSNQDAWLCKAQKTLKNGSNVTKYLVFEQLKRGAALTLAECFRMELVMSCHCGTLGEFQEGVRALLVDKDNQPKWLYTNINDVPAEVIEAFFVSPWTSESHPLASLGA